MKHFTTPFDFWCTYVSSMQAMAKANQDMASRYWGMTSLFTGMPVKSAQEMMEKMAALSVAFAPVRTSPPEGVIAPDAKVTAKPAPKVKAKAKPAARKTPAKAPAVAKIAAVKEKAPIAKVAAPKPAAVATPIPSKPAAKAASKPAPKAKLKAKTAKTEAPIPVAPVAVTPAVAAAAPVQITPKPVLSAAPAPATSETAEMAAPVAKAVSKGA